jgi:hypothetical protein
MNSHKACAAEKLAGQPAQVLSVMFSAVLFAVLLGGCGTSVNTIPAAPTVATGPRLYMTPIVYGGNTITTAATYSIDDKASTFVQQTYAFSDTQSGGQVQYSGNVVTHARGLLELELTYACGNKTVVGCTGTPLPPPPPNGWAMELANQSGGLVQLIGQPFTPMVPAVTCPSMKSAETFLFVTLPAPLITTGTTLDTWNPQLETAYGSVDISASGSTVTLANIKQYILGGGTPSNGPAASVMGACSPTVYGNTVAIPPNPTITTAGSGEISPQALMGIGPSGLLVEDNGSAGHGNSAPYYENALGAGTGAIGLPKPSSAVDTSSLVSAQYLGFFYGSGLSGPTPNWSSSVASFGFSSLPSTCAAVAPQTPTMLYGGDFAGNNPSADTVQLGGGFGNCDFAIDLGTQNPSNNGLFPTATIYVGSNFATNTTGNRYNFPAIAIAGQLNGKFAIFLIGEDTVGSPNQAWGIYLLQSN